MTISERLYKLINSAEFKKTTYIFTIVLFILGLYTIIDPGPFATSGPIGVFVFNALGGAGMYIVPSLTKVFDPSLVAFVTALGMTVNDTLPYVIGKYTHELSNSKEHPNRVKNAVEKYGWLAIFFFSFIPFAYDAVGIAAGYLKMNYKVYALFTFLGKFIRMILIGYGFVMLTSSGQ